MEWSDFLGEKFGDRFYPYWMVSQMANELWNFGIQRDPNAIIFVTIFFLLSELCRVINLKIISSIVKEFYPRFLIASQGLDPKIYLDIATLF